MWKVKTSLGMPEQFKLLNKCLQSVFSFSYVTFSHSNASKNYIVLPRQPDSILQHVHINISGEIKVLLGDIELDLQQISSPKDLLKP